jgi:hypothetical protein
MVHDMEFKPSRGDSGYDDVVRRRHGKMSDIGNSHGNEWDVAAKDALKPLGYHDHGNSPDAWEGIACGPNHYEFQNLEAAKRYRKTGNTSQAVRCEECSFIPFSADHNFKSNEFTFEGEKVMVFRKQNGKYVSLSDDEVDMHAYEFKSVATAREEFRKSHVTANIWGAANHFMQLSNDYSEELLENLSFVVMLKEPNSTSADLYLLPRVIGLKRRRSRMAGGEKCYAYDYNTHAKGIFRVGKSAFDDSIHFAHLEGLTHT